MDRHALAAILDSLVSSPDLAPRYFCKKCDSSAEMHESGGHKFQEGRLVTSCNIFVHRAACHVGYPHFKGLLANEIIQQIRSGNRWMAVEPAQAAQLAWLGHFVVAGATARPHGHVCVVYPGGMVHSAKWQEDVPVVANVGVKNGIFGVNYAFKDCPTFWLLADE